MQRYALVTGLSDEEPAIIELLHEGPQRPLGVGLNLPKHGRNYPYKAMHRMPKPPLRSGFVTGDGGRYMPGFVAFGFGV